MSTPASSSYQCPASSSSSLRPYSYKPLDIGRNEIRLIELQDPIQSLPLRGNIIHVPLSAESRYWALSYCWGSRKGKRTIILDGKKLRITVNLNEALRQLGNSYSLLWVDAICINQEDIPERSREVLRMGDIYSLASGVAVWLGAANKTSDRAMDFVQVLATKAPSSQYEEYLEELPSEDDRGKFVAKWTALKDLSKNGYWSRTWIIQELALCQSSIIIHCGTKSLPWDNFETVFDQKGIFSQSIVNTSRLQELYDVAASLMNLRMLTSERHMKNMFRDAYVCHLLCLTSSFQATDPRDKVYGILALGEKLCQVVQRPNYENSKDDVFRDLTKAMLANGYNLDLICLKLSTHVNRSDVVSWVPSWYVSRPWHQCPNFLFQELEDNVSRGAYSADAGKDAAISYVGNGSILRVRGISYDRVDGLGSTETLSAEITPNRHDVVEPDHRQNAYGSDVDTFTALKQLSQEIFCVSGISQEGYSLNNECLIPRVSQQIASMDLDSTETAFEWLQRTTEFSFVGRSLQQWYEMAYIHGQDLPLASSSSVVQKDAELIGMLETIKRVRFDGWRWLSTDRGYLGRTHPQTQKGDEIVIVQGCSVPMVLRPCGEHYNVVCAAYVQGIMNGEALQGVTDGEMRYFDLA